MTVPEKNSSYDTMVLRSVLFLGCLFGLVAGLADLNSDSGPYI